MSEATVCSTTHLFHYMFNPGMDKLASFYAGGIRPLSDFPESPRWQQLEAEMPGFYRNLYEMMAAPILGRPYPNSGIFVTPIDFRRLPGTYLHDKPRFAIPLARLDHSWCVLTYVIDDERRALPLSAAALQEAAALWDESMVRSWFGRDQTKVFFYVPQVAVYQGRIDVTPADYDGADA